MNLAPELLGMGALAVAGTLWWLTREPPASNARGSPSSLPGAAAPPAWPEPTLQVLDFKALLQTTGTAGALARVEGASGLNAATWQELVLPVLRNVAELVQLLPASEAHHHAQPGGLWCTPAKPWAMRCSIGPPSCCRRRRTPTMLPARATAGPRAS